jgi:hypothetical protein
VQYIKGYNKNVLRVIQKWNDEKRRKEAKKYTVNNYPTKIV